MVRMILEGEADMVNGDRLSSTYFTENKRPFHNGGNRLVRGLINRLFQADVRDIMTGCRAFSRSVCFSVLVGIWGRFFSASASAARFSAARAGVW